MFSLWNQTHQHIFQSNETPLKYSPQRSIHEEVLFEPLLLFGRGGQEGKEELETDLMDSNVTVYLCLQGITLANFISDNEQLSVQLRILYQFQSFNT